MENKSRHTKGPWAFHPYEKKSYATKVVSTHSEMLQMLKDLHPESCFEGWAHCYCQHAKLIRKSEGK